MCCCVTLPACQTKPVPTQSSYVQERRRTYAELGGARKQAALVGVLGGTECTCWVPGLTDGGGEEEEC